MLLRLPIVTYARYSSHRHCERSEAILFLPLKQSEWLELLRLARTTSNSDSALIDDPPTVQPDFCIA